MTEALRGRDWLAELAAAPDDDAFSALVLEIAAAAPQLRDGVLAVAHDRGDGWAEWARDAFPLPPVQLKRESTPPLLRRRLGPMPKVQSADEWLAQVIAKAKAKQAGKPDPKPPSKPVPPPDDEPEEEEEPQQPEYEPEEEPQEEPLREAAASEWAIRPPFGDDLPITENGDRVVLSAKAPYDNAREMARRECWRDGKLVMYSWTEEEEPQFWCWNGQVYQPMPMADIKSRVMQFLDGSFRQELNSKTEKFEYVRFRPNPKQRDDLIKCLHDGLTLPAWADPPMRLSTGERAGDVMAFRNGLVEVETGRRRPAGPDLWLHQDAGYDWNPAQPCPGWLAFLDSIYPGDQEAKDGIEEFMGLTMTDYLGFQKGINLIGATRSGKGTLFHIQTALVGSTAYASMDLDKWLRNDFAGESMIGKKMIMFADVRTKPAKWYGQVWDAGGVEFGSAQQLLKITSGDPVTLLRKWKGPWTNVLPGKVWLASNEPINYNDSTLVGRFLKFSHDVSFLGREDTMLKDRLVATELSGIAGRCLKAYWRARNRGRLIQPRSGEKLNRQIAINSDPFTKFVLETFVPEREATVKIQVAYNRFQQFCADGGHKDLARKVTPSKFKNQIRQVSGFAEITNATRPHGQPRCYLHLRLRTKAEIEADEEN